MSPLRGQPPSVHAAHHLTPSDGLGRTVSGKSAWRKSRPSTAASVPQQVECERSSGLAVVVEWGDGMERQKKLRVCIPTCINIIYIYIAYI